MNDSGRVVERGATGELCTRGYSVMQGGYWGEPGKTAGMRAGMGVTKAERQRRMDVRIDTDRAIDGRELSD